MCGDKMNTNDKITGYENEKTDNRDIPDIPEILKEKELPPRKNSKKIFVIIGFAVLAILIVAGIIFSAFNTVEIAGKKYKKNDTTVSIYDANLSPEDIDAIKKMKAVSYINLSNCSLPGTDLSWITDSTTLSLKNCGLTDEHLKTIDFKSLDLTSFDIDGNKDITDLSALVDVSDTLKTVSFNLCSVSDISFTENLTKLNSLYADSNGISDISSLENCKRLQILSINDNQIESIETLSNCSELREFYVNSNNLTSLNGLEKAIRLEVIEADNNNIIDFSGLADTSVLKKVSLKNNNSTDERLLSGILVKSAESLKELHLDGNLFEDFDSVGKLKLLKILTVDECKYLSSLDFLKTLTVIERFSARSCALTTLKGMKNCRLLTYLELSDNYITSIDDLPDFNQPNVYMNLSNNSLTDIYLPEQSFSTLSLYGNNLDKLDISETSGGEIIIGYCNAFDYATVTDKYHKYKLIDIPLEKQPLIQKKINSYSVEFLSAYEYIDSLSK